MMINLKDIKSNPNNPRIIKDEKFEKLKKSIKDFPKMMELIGSIKFITENMVVMGKSPNGKYKFRLKECVFCKEWFKTKDTKKKYCKKECYSNSMKLNKKCILCNKIIDNKHSVSLKHRKYCSKECQSEARRGVPLSNEWKKALSDGRKKSEKCKGKNLYNWKGGSENTKLLIKNRYYRTKHNIIGKLPKEYLNKILKIQNNRCFYCDIEMINYKAIEHLTPVTKNGDNSIYNLVYSCKRCNSKKRQQTLEEYAIKNNRVDWLTKWENNFIQAL